MKKRKIILIILKSDKASSPSAEAEAEAHMHFSLDVHDAGSSQEGHL